MLAIRSDSDAHLVPWHARDILDVFRAVRHEGSPIFLVYWNALVADTRVGACFGSFQARLTAPHLLGLKRLPKPTCDVATTGKAAAAQQAQGAALHGQLHVFSVTSSCTRQLVICCACGALDIYQLKVRAPGSSTFNTRTSRLYSTRCSILQYMCLGQSPL
eukprot:scaffold48_cov311-Pinguiococcus_pyrenoidosus.AAC.66